VWLRRRVEALTEKVARVRCPYCSDNDDRVIDSRLSEGGSAIRRRRKCNGCSRRFTTYERVEGVNRLKVIKRDGSRVPFCPDNVRRSIELACGKRPISEADRSRLAEQVEEEIHRTFDGEIESIEIGRQVSTRLRDLDEIAYIRFASEYEKFRSVSDILDMAQQLAQRVKDVKEQQPLFDEADGL
jgi:transcriptional repressor NrdR